jgi:hypothetical protein
MSSKRRIQSSRANGAKSRGPITPEGKRKSSANSVRHGFLSTLVVLEDEKTETFITLLDTLVQELNPQTEAQRILVETMAAARWRLLRVWAIERETLQAEIDKHDRAEHPATRAALSFRTLTDQSRTLDLLNRYESRFCRQYARSLNLLIKLASPDCPFTQMRQTNLIPEPHTSAAPSVEAAPPVPEAAASPLAPTEAPLTTTAEPTRRPPAPATANDYPAQPQSHDFKSTPKRPVSPLPRAG